MAHQQTAPAKAQLRPIHDADADAVADYLHRRLNPGVPASAWHAMLTPAWHPHGENHGFQLVTPSGIVGVYAAVYSDREIDGQLHRFCNLAAFCVDEDFRSDSLRLMRALLRQPEVVFTDLSPSGNVVALNERLGFSRLDTATRVALNLPALPRRRFTITEDPEAISRSLPAAEAAVYRDHRSAPACHHLTVSHGDRCAYLIFRRDRRKGLRLFANPIYRGGDRDLLRKAWPSVASHLLLRHGLLFTLAERRILGFGPRLGFDQRSPRPKMFRGADLSEHTVDYLYSELTLVEW